MLILLLECLFIPAHATHVDYLEIQKEIFNTNTMQQKELIIETKTFLIQPLLIQAPVKSEINEVVDLSVAEMLLQSEELKIERKLALLNADMGAAGINIKYPFYITHFTTADYNKILKGTHLAGYGHYFKKIEDKYKVNGLFAISVATQESGLGRSELAKNNNNFYGIKRGEDAWAKFDSKEDGILYFGELMNKSRYRGKTIRQIAPIYCNSEWGERVSSIMSRYLKKIT